MAYQQKNNEGTLFVEKNKRNENSPDFTGKALIGGAEKRIVGWWNRQGDQSRISLKIEDPRPSNGQGGGYSQRQQPPQQREQPRQEPVDNENFNPDDIPFAVALA